VTLRARTFSRAGLAGNPSDAYFGKAIAVPVRNFSATATCRESDGVTVRAPDGEATYRDWAHLHQAVRRNGYQGPQGVLTATVHRFFGACESHDIDPKARGLVLSTTTDIPVRVGLAGSSALVISALRALAWHFEVEIPPDRMATLALQVETDELSIHGGLMDRVVQVYECPVYIDLDRTLLRRYARGRYERLESASLPPLFLAWDPAGTAGSETVHNELRRRFERNEPGVRQAMLELAAMADEARQLLLAGRGDLLGPIMDANFDVRASIVSVGEVNLRLVETARRHGAAAKQAGSGGAVIGTYDGDPERLARLRDSYAAIGARLVVPDVG
jgi:glucuronokinase